MPERSSRPFADELPRLLAERGVSLRQFADAVEISVSHLSKITRRRNNKRVTPELAQRAAEALDLPSDYFPETREAYLLGRIRKQPRLRDRLYDELRRRRS